ncbi:MAG: hypothetical protein C0402_01005 [Thermodesulfovibrio sp.]|nr:hypothetical protein [Thermodesulfovibrio sp.]
MQKKTWLIIAVISIALTSLCTGTAFSAEAALYLDQQTDYPRTDFGSGSYTGYTFLWAGNVWYNGVHIGDFTANITKTTFTGYDGVVMNYDIIIPQGGAIAEFFSVRANHISTGSGAAKGIIYATSPAWSNMVGLPVNIYGDTLIITY